MGKVLCLQCQNQGALVSMKDGGGAVVTPCECPAGETWREHFAKYHPDHTGQVSVLLPAPTVVHEHLIPILSNFDVAMAWKGLLETGLCDTNIKSLWRLLVMLAREHQLDYQLGVPQFNKKPSKGFRTIRLRQFQPVLAL